MKIRMPSFVHPADAGSAPAKGRFRAIGGALLLLVLTVAVMIVHNLVQTGHQVERMHNEAVRGVKLIGALMEQIGEARRHSLYTLTSADPNVQLESADASRSGDPKVEGLLREYASLVGPMAPTAVGRRLPEIWLAYRAVRNAVLAAVLEGSREQGLELDRHAGLAAFKLLHEALAQSDQFFARQSELRLEQIRAVSRRNILTVVLLLALVLAGAVLALRSVGHTAELFLRSQERFELAVAGSSDGIWDWDLASGRTYFSPRWKSMIGFADGEFVNHILKFEERLHPEDRERVLSTLKDYLEGRSAIFEAEFRLRHRDGFYLWILSRGTVVRDARGKALRMAGAHTDITGRRLAATEQARLTAILEATPDFVGSADPGGRVLYVNRAGRRMTGRDEHSDLSRCSIRELHPGWVNRLLAEEALPAAARDGLWLGETAVLDGNGSEVAISQVIIAHKASDGTVEFFSTIARDISARKKRQKDLEALHLQLVDASRMAGMAEVATGVLHNVGNVLNSVNVSAALVVDQLRKSKTASLAKAVALLGEHSADVGRFIGEDPKGKQLPAFLAAVSEQLAREQGLLMRETQGLQQNIEHIKQIVAMQQSYAKVSGALEQIAPKELVEDALRMASTALARHQIELVREFEAVPPVLVDRHKVLQILVNLVNNAKQALDHRAEGRRLVMRIGQRAGERVRVEVSDNGMGVAPENLTKIFQHGFTTKKTGHGFGLHSGANAAREIGGSLSVHSAGPGTGATFILELPAVKLAAKTSAASADERVGRSAVAA